jgi:hypothetical protein
VGRSFALGLALVVLVAAAGILLLRPADDAPAPARASLQQDLAGVPSTARVTTGSPPPAREDLLQILCSGDVVRKRCAHRLMELYRACGTDLAHPRTDHCDAEVDRVRVRPRRDAAPR